MSKAPITVIDVHLKHRAGWFYACSRDLPELHVCGEDHKAVMRDVCPIIKKLYKLNYGVDLVVQFAAQPDLKPVKPTATIKDHLVRLLAFPATASALQPA